MRPTPSPPSPLFSRSCRWAWPTAALAIAGCSAIAPSPPRGADISPAQRVAALLPVEALLIGEQHDASEHQVIEREAVEALSRTGRLAALAIEMAEDGNQTAHLAREATEAQVQTALSWNDKGWPWTRYGPVVMAAVRAGVPVVGANLPRDRMKDAMADVSLDVQLGPEAIEAQRQAVRSGHCDLLPEAQIGPMTRIQIARDRAMAQAIVKARAAGKTVLLVSGAGHAARLVGVPQHLPSDMTVKSVRLKAGAGSDKAGEAAIGSMDAPGAFDAVWPTPALPEVDYCASLRSPSSPSAPSSSSSASPTPRRD
ncbi:conserved hypothetical protein [Burkholderiales bacterium 8X]|nr:conserved hypothetical protein [Burkholderiales bacterium 8X]